MPSAAGRHRPAISAHSVTGLAAGLMAALAVSGCFAALAPQAAAPAAVAAADISQLTRAMAERDRALESFQTDAVMEYRNGSDHVKAREAIAVRRPSSLRVEAMSPFGVALIVAAQDTRLQIFEPSNNTFMQGTATAATLARFVRIPMAPRDAVGLLMGIVPEAQNTAHPDSVTSDGDVTVLGYGAADGGRRELGFQNNELAIVRESAPGGMVSYEIRYSDYHDIGGVMFAYQVDADFPSARTHVGFRYKRPIINGNLPDSFFVLTPGPNAKRADIGMRDAPPAATDG